MIKIQSNDLRFHFLQLDCSVAEDRNFVYVALDPAERSHIDLRDPA